VENEITVETVVTVNGVKKTYATTATTDGRPQPIVVRTVRGVADQATWDAADGWWNSEGDR
jgi:hypothetical protein